MIPIFSLGLHLNKNQSHHFLLLLFYFYHLYFTDNERDAFFVREKETNKLLGFVMINTYMQKCNEGHSIAEFMIIPKYRRNKIGKKVAFECFDMYKGNWEVSPSFGNDSAYKFWKKVIDEYTKNDNIFIDGIFILSPLLFLVLTGRSHHVNS